MPTQRAREGLDEANGQCRFPELFAVRGYGVVVTGRRQRAGARLRGGPRRKLGARVTLLDLNAAQVAEQSARLTAAGLMTCVASRSTSWITRPWMARLTPPPNFMAGWMWCSPMPVSTPGLALWTVGWRNDRKRVPEGALENYTEQALEPRVIDVNLNGVFATLRAAARHMRPRRSGRIIVTTSLAANKVEPAIGSAYIRGQAGNAFHLTQCVALELGATASRSMRSRRASSATSISAAVIASSRKCSHDRGQVRYPMHRVGFPDDLKGLALFLASTRIRLAYITGQQITIDGGWGLGFAD